MARAVYYVVLHNGLWKINYDGEHYGPYKTQQAAIDEAVKTAKKAAANGNPSQVLVQGKDNKFRTEWTYGADPYPPKG